MHSQFKVLQLLLANGYHDPNQIITHLEVYWALKGCDTVLDVGCGANSVLQLLGFKRITGAEGYVPRVEKARKAGTHHEELRADARNLEKIFKVGEFDACVALDVIEHLPKQDGLQMIRSMENISGKKTVFLTPKGFLHQGHIEDKDLQEHLSGWEPEEMRTHGYQVTGILGPKNLRGEYHMLVKRPKFFWGLVSLLGHYLTTRSHPEKAAAILCVKRKANC